LVSIAVLAQGDFSGIDIECLVDACEKLRFEAIANLADGGGRNVGDLIRTRGRHADVKDNGIGMSQDEVIDNLGTIARSGTKKFLEDERDSARTRS